MKNNSLKLLKLFTLAVFSIFILFASCEVFTPPVVGDIPQDIFRSDRSIELDRWEEFYYIR